MLRTYQAFTFEDALERIRAELGAEAVILHSRTFKRGSILGIGGRKIVEVTASTPAPRIHTATGAAGPVTSAAADARRSKQQDQPSKRQSSPDPRPQKPVPNDQIAQSLQHLIDRARKIAAPKPPAAPPCATAPKNPTSPSVEFSIDHRHKLKPDQGPAAPAKNTPSGDPHRPRRFILQPAGKSPSSSASETPVTSPQARVIPGPPQPHAGSNGASNGTKPDAAALPVDDRWEQDLAALKSMVGQVLQRQSGSLMPAMPDRLLEQYTKLIENEVARELADQVCFAVRDELDEDEINDGEKVRAAICSHLAAYINVSDDPTRTTPVENAPFTLALVGPTGVGKTTTVAKLAATFKLRQSKRVGLITTDTYRIAAVDQLRTYANIIGIPLRVALSPDEIRQARSDLDYCDVLLIDTAGRSPNDSDRIDEIDRFLKAAQPHEVHLVLSSTLSESVLIKTIDRFAHLAAQRIIFTKLDEAVSFGVLVNVMRKAGKSLSFVTTGQEVPDQIEPGSAQRIARLVLGESLRK